MFLNKNYVIEDAKSIKVFKLQMKGKNIVLDFINEQIVVHKEDNNSMFWHKRMGHYHHKALLFHEEEQYGERLA